MLNSHLNRLKHWTYWALYGLFSCHFHLLAWLHSKSCKFWYCKKQSIICVNHPDYRRFYSSQGNFKLRTSYDPSDNKHFFHRLIFAASKIIAASNDCSLALNYAFLFRSGWLRPPALKSVASTPCTSHYRIPDSLPYTLQNVSRICDKGRSRCTLDGTGTWTWARATASLCACSADEKPSTRTFSGTPWPSTHSHISRSITLRRSKWNTRGAWLRHHCRSRIRTYLGSEPCPNH